ncbi:MAG: VCBS repeat-containing protein [Candidatus Aminicenantes bacterium]|nr:VCBS repeat-containing protein [Candidatus Aminicenantes bacterium]
MKRWAGFFALCLAFGVAATAATMPPFKQVRIAVDGELDDIARGDFNRDKRDDIVMINSGAKTIRVVLGDNILGFARSSSRSFNYLGKLIVGVADFTGDGKLDLAVDSLYYKTYFALFPGTGTGTFQAPRLVNASGTRTTDFSHACVVDVNGDKKPDIAALLIDSYNYSAGVLGVFINKGGRFALTVVETTKYTCLAAGDVDGDRDQDLIVGDWSTDDLTVFLNQGKGTFVKGPVTRAGEVSSRLKAGYVNGDNRLDVVGSVGALGSGWCLLGTGKGTFVNKKSLPRYNDLAHGFVLADLNGDGKPDLVEPDLNEVTLLGGLGTGTFKFQRDLAPGLYFGRLERGAANMIGGDFNGDKKIDLAGYHWNGYNGRTPEMTDLVVFANGKPATACSISDLNVTELRYASGVIYFSGSFNFQNSAGDLRYAGSSVVTDNVHWEFKIELDFPYPLRDYVYGYRATGDYLNYPGLTSGTVSFNLTLPTTVFSTASAATTLADVALWDSHLVRSNILLED